MVVVLGKVRHSYAASKSPLKPWVIVHIAQLKLHITLDEDLMKESVPKAERFYKLCILPELLGKWFTRLPVYTAWHRADIAVRCSGG